MVNPKHVFIVAQDFKGWVYGFEVEAIDTAGAGDSFLGGFLSILAAHNYIYKVGGSILILYCFCLGWLWSLEHIVFEHMLLVIAL